MRENHLQATGPMKAKMILDKTWLSQTSINACSVHLSSILGERSMAGSMNPVIHRQMKWVFAKMLSIW